MSVNVGDFKQEVECVYKGEQYAVRDNGAILRYPRDNNRPRPTDNKWTFGKPNDKTGYMEIASVRIHRIVATAFHGEPLTKEHVVDHIDTNKRNNRPENLRWVTRLENVLLNPITAKRIAYICGSVEAFLANPSQFRDKFQNPDYKWMATVSDEEAQASWQRLQEWAKSDKPSLGGSLGDWIYKPILYQQQYEPELTEISDLTNSQTLNAVQRNWQTSSEFPCCPQEFSNSPIEQYAAQLKENTLFCQNEIYSSKVLNNAITDNGKTIFVLTESTEGENATKPWGLAKITFEDNKFVHESIQSFFSKEDAEKTIYTCTCTRSCMDRRRFN